MAYIQPSPYLLKEDLIGVTTQKTLNIRVPKEPSEAITAIVAYAGIAKRLHVELSTHAEAIGLDLDQIKTDLISEAKKAVPHNDFSDNEIRNYNIMFEAIDTIFKPID
ncbi:hypothetical protein [Roseibium alexandrii]|jgi:trans-aconitate methyltransferase|uniref:Uncharacterized protein n=1 Tax=Roseibium alexandrii TaxID=388408 RepID=A0A0M7A471_9HYPH|nr:hypothetical protein [Roseibium alexandrii]CTQ68533.1 hypothetical protein LAX5112_01775 [Roseibium alexandrii]